MCRCGWDVNTGREKQLDITGNDWISGLVSS